MKRNCSFKNNNERLKKVEDVIHVMERLKIKSTKSPWKKRQRNVIYGRKDKTQRFDLRISSNRVKKRKRNMKEENYGKK